jgi:hypothetical protein
MFVNRVILSALAVASLLFMPDPALAQRTGSRIGKNADAKDVGKLTQLLAECMVDRRSKMVRTWFDELPGTASEFKFIQRQEGDLSVCLDDDELVFAGSREMVFSPKSLRYPFALAYARKSLREVEGEPNGLNPDSSPWFMAPYAALPAGSEIDKVSLVLQDFGHCVASSNWQGSRAFLLSDAGSDQERAAVKALASSLGPCLQEGSEIKLTPQNLRVALAEPMVHILSGVGKEAAK